MKSNLTFVGLIALALTTLLGFCECTENGGYLQLNSKVELPRILYKHIAFLNPDNFDETMTKSGFDGHLVFFGARWCGHSRQFNKTFKDLGDIVMRGDLSRTPKLSYYLIQNPKDDQLHLRFRVSGFPTLVYISDKKVWQYQGERELPKIVTWIEEIFNNEGKEGSPYPVDTPSLWSELSEVWRDMKYTLRHNLKHYPTYTWCAIVLICVSVGSVLFIFGILIYDSFFIGDSYQEVEVMDPDKKEK